MPADPRPDAWLAEILGQPAAMERAATALVARADLLADLAAACRPGGHIVLTGMGSSAAACGAAATVLGGAGLLATPIETAELLHFRLPALAAGGTLVIISQSGAGAELLRLLDALASSPKRPFVVGVTNGDTNPLARRADFAFDTAAGDEVGPSSGTLRGDARGRPRSFARSGAAGRGGRGGGRGPGPGARHGRSASRWRPALVARRP